MYSEVLRHNLIGLFTRDARGPDRKVANGSFLLNLSIELGIL